MSNKKEWVTIKIPKETRDAAREDSRTYGEVMADGLDKNAMQESPEGIEKMMGGDIKEEIERVRAIVENHTTNEPVTLEATEYRKIADELEGRLR